MLRGASALVLARASTPRQHQRAVETVQHDAQGRYEPFPLTPVQAAYLIGRTDAVALGGRSAHYYVEIEVDDVSAADLESSLNAIIERHDALRTVMTPDGLQRVLRSVPRFQLEVHEAVPGEAGSFDALERRLRSEMSDQRFDPARWPLFDVRAVSTPSGALTLHVSVDLLLLDAQSIAILVGEWLSLATGAGVLAPAPAITHRDVVLATQNDERWEAARDYWLAQLEALPPAPDLPRRAGAQDVAPKFTRRSCRLGRREYAALRRQAESIGVTASVLLAAVYAEALAGWSAEPQFALNVTLSGRPFVAAEVGGILGDFTSSLLLRTAPDVAGTLAGRARAMQAQMEEDLEYALFGGVEVQREIAVQRGMQHAAMPVVFTSLLNESGAIPDALALTAREVFGRSQTPHVIIDNQVIQSSGTLVALWDAAEEVLDDGLLDGAFSAYEAMLRTLASGEWPDLPRLDLAGPRRRQSLGEAGPRRQDAALHEAFDRAALQSPDAVAVTAGGEDLSYAQLSARARDVAAWVAQTTPPGAAVAVVMRPGWQQVAAVLGVSRAGRVYLPVDATQPVERVRTLLDEGRARAALVQQGSEEHQALSGLPRLVVGHAMPSGDGIELPVVGADDPAYVIFTSGSTGRPKGVVMQHGAVVNTLEDVNRRWRVRATDRVLSVSALNFDLSVFDLFGVLGAGGSVVLPDAARWRDVEHWWELVEREEVTIWNSVPQLLSLFVEHAERTGRRMPPSVRLALLSGDWIPTGLPARVRALDGQSVELVSLGGATEAAIWSIYYPIDEVDPSWLSIPYGCPLANQRVRVLDHLGRDRPDGAIGELHIGGDGLAKEYLGRPDLTAERFITHPVDGTRLYRTGDFGRFLPDGLIEFLGRRDNQVKVGGHRIELGEIEASLLREPHLETAVVKVVDEPSGARRLVAYAVPSAGASADSEHLLGALRNRLPAYMVPVSLTLLPEGLPLTANGKVDLSALPEPELGLVAVEGHGDHVATPQEQVLQAAWTTALGRPVGRAANFFELGGDSLLAIRIIAEASSKGVWLTPRQFFDHPTIEGQASVAADGPTGVEDRGPLEGPIGLSPSQYWLLDQAFADPSHWNGMWPLFELDEPLDGVVLQTALNAVVDHHDGLRQRFAGAGAHARSWIEPPGAAPAPVDARSLAGVAPAELDAAIEQATAQAHASLDLERGPLVRLTLLTGAADRPDYLVFSAHWLVMDYYSSRVFFADLQAAYAQVLGGEAVVLPPHTARLDEALRALEAYADGPARAGLSRWQALAERPPAPMPFDGDDVPDIQADQARLTLTVDAVTSTTLLGTVLPRERVELREALMAAVSAAVTEWAQSPAVTFEVEGHGRDVAFADLDISRTIGRFSTVSPVRLEGPGDMPRTDHLRRVVDELRGDPGRGVGFGALRYAATDPAVRDALAGASQPTVGFNFWGDVTEYFAERIRPVPIAFGPHRALRARRPRTFDVMALVSAGELVLSITFSERRHSSEAVLALLQGCADEVRRLVDEYETDATC